MHHVHDLEVYQKHKSEATGFEKGTFGYDVEFLKKHTETIYLSDEEGKAGILICPAYQGRVMTSTLNGNSSLSYGWINYELISSGKLLEHINPFGGEDRLWLGPEGGQFSIFFEEGDPFDLDHWYTPAPLDTEAFDLVLRANDHVQLVKRMGLKNYSGTAFDVLVDRVIRLLPRDAAFLHLNIDPLENLDVVAFQSENSITNTGKKAWEKASGLLSLWNLSMFKASEKTTVIIPLTPSSNPEAFVNDKYFGKVPGDRMKIKDNVIYFKGDALCRSKIGVNREGTQPILGSYDAENKVLTLVQFTFDRNEEDYINSMWEMQTEPYNGDVVNTYNDGPQESGKQLGNFYELETSSAAAALRPEEKMFHLHRVMHFSGREDELNRLAEQTLGVNLQEAQRIF